MEKIGIHDARARLSELIARVEAGEEVVLTRHGRPVVRMVAATAGGRKPRSATVARIRALRKALDIRAVDIGALVREGRRWQHCGRCCRGRRAVCRLAGHHLLGSYSQAGRCRTASALSLA